MKTDQKDKKTTGSRMGAMKYETLEGTEVLQTYEYNVFVKDLRNRPIHIGKVNEFVKEFKKGNFFMQEFPAIVDEDFVILDGQHRHEACKALKLPFYFRFSSKLKFENIVDIQSNAGWKTSDYIHAYIKQGKQDYVVLQRFITRYDLSATLAVHILLNGLIALSDAGFYTGNFKIKNETKAHEIAKLITQINDLLPKKIVNKTFGMAVLYIYNRPDFNSKRLLNQVAKYTGLLRQQTTKELFIRNLEEVYNYHLTTKNKVRFT